LIISQPAAPTHQLLHRNCLLMNAVHDDGADETKLACLLSVTVFWRALSFKKGLVVQNHVGYHVTLLDDTHSFKFFTLSSLLSYLLSHFFN